MHTDRPRSVRSLPDAGDTSIVVLGEKDAAELAALEGECFSTPWSEERYRDILGAVDKALKNTDGAWEKLPPFMAFGLRGKDGALAAYISLGLHHAAGELEIYNIAVRQSMRRRGHGTVLLESVLGAARRNGVSRAVLEVRTGNTSALALYARAGFVECGRRKGYYADTGEDALVLCLNM